MIEHSNHPGVIVPPPILYAAGVVAMVILDWFRPAPIADPALVVWIGAALLGAGVGFNLWGIFSMITAQTPINPYRATRVIVDTGAFRVSRNPLYVGLDGIFLGLAFILNNVWGVVLLAPVLVVMHYGVILREERYLDNQFGESYRNYCAKVRRYL